MNECKPLHVTLCLTLRGKVVNLMETKIHKEVEPNQM